MTNQNLVVQFFMKPEGFSDPEYNSLRNNNDLLKYSLKSAELYAKKVGADYKLVTEPKVKWKHPTFERLDLFYNEKWWNDYDHILYLDTDVIVWPQAPSVFELYKDLESFKPVRDKRAERYKNEDHLRIIKGTCLEGEDINWLRNNRFNAGVFMLNKKSAQQMSPYLDCAALDSDDNTMLVYAMLKSKVKVTKMDPLFNKKNGKYGTYFGHAFGGEKHKGNFIPLRQAKSIFD